MTIKTDIHVGDIGTIFRVTIADKDIPVDISDATIRAILFQKPDGTVVTVSGLFTIDGEDGRMEYETIYEDLDMAGVWKIGAKITTPDGKWTATPVAFMVEEEY